MFPCKADRIAARPLVSDDKRVVNQFQIGDEDPLYVFLDPELDGYGTLLLSTTRYRLRRSLRRRTGPFRRPRLSIEFHRKRPEGRVSAVRALPGQALKGEQRLRT